MSEQSNGNPKLPVTDGAHHSLQQKLPPVKFDSKYIVYSLNTKRLKVDWLVGWLVCTCIHSSST